MADVLYVFISGYYKEFRDNLFKTLSLPKGSIVRYTFHHDATQNPVINNINKKVGLSKTKGLSFVKTKIRTHGSKIETIIVFVDRGREYQFYPIRKAILKSYRILSDKKKIELYLALDEYVFAKKTDEISLAIKAFQGIPHPVDGDETDDGKYFAFQENVFPEEKNQLSEQCYIGAKAWESAVEYLNEMKAFRTPDNESLKSDVLPDLKKNYPIFYRFELLEQKNDQRATHTTLISKYPKYKFQSAVECYFARNQNKDFYIKVFYYFPLQRRISDLKPVIIITGNDRVKEIGRETIESDDTSTNSIDVKCDLEKNTNKVKVHIECRDGGNTEIKCPDTEFELRLKNKNRKKYSFLVVCCLFYFLASTYIAGMESINNAISSIQNPTVITYFVEFFSYVKDNLAVVIVELLKLLSIIFITILNSGKKLF